LKLLVENMEKISLPGTTLGGARPEEKAFFSPHQGQIPENVLTAILYRVEPGEAPGLKGFSCQE
jgi:hypothetical protein